MDKILVRLIKKEQRFTDVGGEIKTEFYLVS